MEPTQTNTSISDEYVEQAHYLANEHSEEILSSLGLVNKYSKKIQCACPVHGGDNPQGFSWHPSKKVWKCWTNLCHEKYGSNLIGLIRGIRQCSLDEAIEYIHSICGDTISLSEVRRKEFVKNKLFKEEAPTIYDMSSVEENNHEVEYFKQRGLNVDILDKYKCFECIKPNHPLVGRACIPLINDDNQIVGFNGRITNDVHINEFCPKWRLFPHDLSKSKVLFNLNYAKSFIEKTRTVVIVEGALDSMWLSQAEVYNNVACLGTSISIEQIKLLLKYKTRNIVVAFDPDKGGKKGLELVKEKVKLYFNVYDLDLKKDPSDYTIEEINSDIKPVLESIYAN
jgi:DNA primase